MFRILFISALGLALVAGAASGEGEKAKSKPTEQKLSGMSIVGNDEAPKSLAIVPWKASELGETLNAIKALDAGRQPVDKDVFVRALDYYEIRVGAAQVGGAERN